VPSVIAHSSRGQNVPAILVVALFFASLILSVAAIAAPNPVAAIAASPSGRYTVLGTAAPLAAYQGGVAGLAATDPSVTGATQLDATNATSAAYLTYLEGQHRLLEAAVETALGRSVTPLFTYETVLNGIVLEMSAAEAGRVAALAGVSRVVPDVELELLTDNGPAWIGAPSIWGGGANGTATKGEGIVAGVIDSGINHDHPSFADIGGDGYNHTNPHGTFHGLCDPLTGLPYCNDKLIGVYDFTGVGTGPGPEDDNGHGSHTASTVAGNVVDAALHAPTLTVERPISGVAPHANIIAYKACITTPAAGACLQTGTVASIDQAVRDGVDVINFSIGGSSRDPWTDLNGIAFLNAQRAGVFLAVSAGNDGPGQATVGSPADSPWVTAVGASTHDRKFFNSLVGMSGGGSAAPADMRGQSITAGYGPAPIVYAGDYGFPLCGDGPANEATGDALINPFPAGTFHGEIVVCDRGTYGRVEKGANVKEGGAGGYVLVNDEASGDSLVADPYPLPGVHLTYAQGLVLKAWLASGSGHTASITGTVTDIRDSNGDVMASFSSRGQNPSVPGVIKPDVTAPGVDILAAFNTPIGGDGDPAEFNVISGTSMSGPHTAGAGALLRSLHPDWTPDQVRSALMTTAITDGVLKEDAATPADPFDRGGGRLNLADAARAGLVFNESADAYQAASPATGGDPTALNIPSLGSADCDGTCSWTRIVTGTAGRSVTWTAVVSAPAGMGLTVSPSSFTLGSGARQTLQVAADVTGVTNGGWTFAEVRLVPSDASVPAAHLPVAVLVEGDPGGVPRTTLHFQGNADEGCTGDGRADLVACDGPFLSANAVLDAASAASWVTTTDVDGTADRNIYDANWVWNLESPTTVGGPMTVNWWGACAACAPPAGSADWTIRLWADGVQVIAQRITATPAAATGPSLLEATIIVPETTAAATFVLHIDPVYVDVQNPSTTYYDSSGPCTATVEGPCDSTVLMPVLGQEPVTHPDLQVTNMTASNTRAPSGERVTVTATVTNAGDGDAAASQTEFRLDGGTVLGVVDTAALAAGASATVSVIWDTRGVSGEHVIAATADVGGTVAESAEDNNLGHLTVTVRGNKVRNSSFEQPNASGTGPDGWSENSTSAGTASWSQGGSDGERSATITGTGGSVVLGGLPTWTSDPIAVTAGEVLTLTAKVRVSGASSAPSVGLAYLGPTGALLDTVTVLAAPLTTDGFAALSQNVTIPQGVVSVRVVLAGFAATDLHTVGTVTFDEIGLFAQ
jgi:subtilisin family serine protease